MQVDLLDSSPSFKTWTNENIISYILQIIRYPLAIYVEHVLYLSLGKIKADEFISSHNKKNNNNNSIDIIQIFDIIKNAGSEIFPNLIPNELDSLKYLRRIRNIWAHQEHISDMATLETIDKSERILALIVNQDFTFCYESFVTIKKFYVVYYAQRLMNEVNVINCPDMKIVLEEAEIKFQQRFLPQ